MNPVPIHGSRPNRLKRAVAKVLHEPAYILHSQPYRDTSLLLDVLTRHHGRVSVLAKGAKRPYTQWRASSFQTFQTLSMSFTSKAEVKILLDAEWVGGIPMLQGAALISGYYMNEWLRRGLVHEDAHESLFDAYQHSLADLSFSPLIEHAAVLREFEWHLLHELGFGVPKLTDEIDPNSLYGLSTKNEWVRAGKQDIIVHGQTLIDLQILNFHTAQTAQESKMLLRHFLQRYIGNQSLQTRNLLLDLQGLSLIL